MGEFVENNIKNKYMENKSNEIKTLANIGELEPADLSELGESTSSSTSTSSSDSSTSSSDASSTSESSSTDTKDSSSGTSLSTSESSSDTSTDTKDSSGLSGTSTSESSGPNKIIGDKKEQEQDEETQEEEEEEEELDQSEETESITEISMDEPVEPIVSPDEDQYTDKLNMFYELKNKYETNKYEQCGKKLITDVGSWKLKRKKFALCKPKCVNCNRRVGSIFSIKYVANSNNGYKSFIGKCGDAVNPCPFKIEFNLTNTSRVDELYRKSMVELSRMQMEVIVAKNEAVFGMIEPDEAVEKFNNLTTDIMNHTTLMEKNINRYINVVQNQAKQDELKKKMIEFNENVAGFKLLLLNSDETVVESIKASIELLHQVAGELSNLKYAMREVIENPDNIYRYMTAPFVVSELEIAPDMQVISFNVGQAKPVLNTPEPALVPKKKAQTKKKSPPVKNKTVRKGLQAKDITDSLIDLFQTLIIEDRITTLTASEAYKILEDQYKIKNVKETYGNIVKNYIRTNIVEWQMEYPYIIDVIYKMTQDKTPRGNIFIELNKKQNTPDKPPVNYEKKYNRVINEIMKRYSILLESVPQNAPIPKPNWPKL